MEQHFINRELSWLEFNNRVLQEAMDKKNPLVERVHFMGIFSNNRDEFFRVRVSAYKRFVKLKEKQENLSIEIEHNFDPEEVLRQIDVAVSRQEILFDRCFEDLVQDMAAYHILFIDENMLTPLQGSFVRNFFREKVRSYIFPLMLSNSKDLQGKLHDGEIYFVITMASAKNPERTDIAIVSIPTQRIGRFLILPDDASGKKRIMFLDDVIRYCFKDVFSVFGYDTFNAYTIKFTRDAELDIDNDMLRSYAQILEQKVKQRKKGNPVRFIYDRNIPKKALDVIMKRLKIKETDTIYAAGRYHNFKDFIHFPLIDRPDFYFKPLPPLEHPAFSESESIFTDLKKGDILLHYPYHSFNYIVDLLREAAMDKQVVSVDMTFYRGASNSSIVNALINAARNGKKVRVYLELLARFDEEANLNWAAQMQEEGINIIPAIQGYKVHSKILSIKRKENDVLKYYTNISTGNFNETTARAYTDQSILTANDAIGKEANAIFDMLEYRFQIPFLQNLIISPFYTRKFILRKINSEINAAKQGKKAWMILKMNSLSDKSIIEKLYKASQAGVQITLIIRGICSLRSGVSGLSENIEVFSLVGRFLEHSRIFVFSNNENPQYYIGSADLMARNLDNRVECMTPVLDPKLCQQLWDLLQMQLCDNVKLRQMLPDGSYEYVSKKKRQPVHSQENFYEYVKKLNERDASH